MRERGERLERTVDKRRERQCEKRDETYKDPERRRNTSARRYWARRMEDERTKESSDLVQTMGVRVKVKLTGEDFQSCLGWFTSDGLTRSICLLGRGRERREV